MLKYINMACINTNLPEFKELQKQYKSGFKAYSAVTRWQKATNSDIIPTIEQIRDMDSVQEFLLKKDIQSFTEQLVGNLLNIDLVEKLNGVYVLRGGIEAVKQKAKLIKNYLYINNIPQSMVKFARIKNTDDYKLVVDESALTRIDIIPKTRSNNTTKTKAIITHLQNVFPQVKIEMRKAREVRELYLNIPEEQRANVDYKDIKSFYDPSTMTSYILTDRVDDETPIEELLHPFIDAVKQDNPELYKNLLAEAKANFPQLKLIIDRDYSNKRGYSQNIRDIELVTQSLTRHFKNEYEKKPTTSFVDKVREFLAWFFNTIVDGLHKVITGKNIRSSKDSKQITVELKDQTTREYDTYLKSLIFKVINKDATLKKSDYLEIGLKLLEFSDDLFVGFETTDLFKKYHNVKAFTKNGKYRLDRSFITDEQIENLADQSKTLKRKYYKYLYSLKKAKVDAIKAILLERKIDLLSAKEKKEVKTIIDRIIEFIQNLFSNKANQPVQKNEENLTEIEQYIDNIIYASENFEVYVPEFQKPNASYKRINFDEVVNNSAIGKHVIENLVNFKGVLTGSLAYSPYGDIFRNPDNILHDIDIIYDKNRDQSNSDFTKVFPESVLAYDIQKNEMLTYIVPLPGAEIRNVKRRTSEMSMVTSYEVFRDGERVGTFELQYDVDEFGEVINRVEIKNGEEATFVDIFYNQQESPYNTEYNYNGNIIKLNDPVDGFNAKLKIARQKDMIDFMNFNSSFAITSNVNKIAKDLGEQSYDTVESAPSSTIGFTVSEISPTATLSDIAKLLNTSDIAFEFNKPTDLKVKYALSSERKKIILGIKRRANATQNAIIDSITEVTKQSKYDVDSFSALKSKDNVVIFDEATKEFVNLNTGETPKSVSEDIFGAEFASKTDQLRKDLNGDIDKIIEGAVLGKPLDELGISKIQTTPEEGNRFSEAERLYRYFSNVIRQLDSDSVAVPNVVVYDPVKNIADKVDLVVITRTGKTKLINFHLTTPEGLADLNKANATASDTKFAGLYSTMSEKQLLNTRLQVQRRLMEAVIGTDQMSNDNSSMQTYIVSVKIEDGKITEEINTENVLTVESAEVDKADEIIEDRYQFVDEMEKNFYDPMQEEVDNFYIQEAVLQKANEMADIETISRGLQNFKKGLITRREALKKIKSSIYVDVSKAEAINDIDLALSQINAALASENQQELNSTYSYFLRNSIREVNRFIDYLQDPKNFGKEEFVSYALNAKRFAVTYQGLYSVDNATNLNVNLKALTSDLQAALNMLQGNVMTDEMNVSDLAILDHIKTMVKMTTSQDLTEEELDDVLRYAKDITKAEYLTRDLATSRDVILRVMNKIYHNKKMQVLDSVATYEQLISSASAKLLKLSPTTDRQKLFLFMLNDDGTYIQKIGDKFRKRVAELKDKIYDDNGNPLEYIKIEDLSKAKKEDIAFNKKLADDKRALSEFLTAEITDVDGMFADGPNRKYSQAFKDIRDQYEQYDKSLKQWVIKTGVTKEKYEEYRLKYYEEKTYLTVERDSYGQPTGLTKEVTRKFPRSVVNGVKLIEVRETNAAGESYLDPRYQRMLQPETELERVQLEFYQMYDKVYNEMLQILPPGVRYQMNGRIPVVANKLLKGTENKKNIVTKFFAKMSRGVQSFFEETVEQRSVTIDENGELVDSLGVFYVGNLRDEEKLKDIEVSIEVLQNKYSDGKINRDQYDKQIKILKGQRKKLRAKPAAGELSLDLGSNLMKFVGMAENFRIMTQAEDTLNAMVKVIEKRSYQLSDDKIVLGKLKDGEFEEKAAIRGADSNTLKRAKAFMKMVFYDNEKANKGTLDKIVDGVLQYTSLAYVGLNPFGSFNNYAFARISNYIEVLGGSRYFDRKAYLRAEAEFNKYGIPGFLNRMSSSAKNLNGKYFYDPEKPGNKYEALVDFLRMMDTKGELREMTADFDQKSFFRRAADFAYYLQDIGEYNVQTKVGMAIIMSTYIKNSKTGETLSLYDAFDFNLATKEVKLKDGFDMVIKKNKTTGKWQDVGIFDDNFRYNLRSKIREVNKQIHGNYARDDRMVIQSTTVGKLAAQFHKWVAPAINARFQKEYYDENLGWMEGRYRSWLRYIQSVFGQLSKGNLDLTSYNEEFKKHYGFKGDGSQADQKITNRLQGFYRTTAELTIIGMIFMLKSVLEASFGEDDDDNVSDEVKRFRNFLRYQTDRTYKDMVIFIPIIPSGAEQIYQMFKSPIASTRTMGDMARAISTTVNTGFGYTFRENDELFWSDKDYVYQRGIRKGQLKMSKYWNDVIPIFRSIQKYTDFLNMTNYYIK